MLQQMMKRSVSTMILKPPESVKGIRKWNPELFRKSVSLPFAEVAPDYIPAFKRRFGKYLLKRPNLRPVENGRILLDPDLLNESGLSDSDVEDLTKLTGKGHLETRTQTLTLDNWAPAECLDAVLEGQNVSKVTSYSIIGHIVHVNLSREHDPFKSVIGEILLRHKNIKTVVNKTKEINSEFRQFSMEVLAGDAGSMEVEVKEHGCRFRLDFSKVYWNPRLSTEHQRMVELISGVEKPLIFYDVFAGVGPFAVPVGKLKNGRVEAVHANDLNPDSFKWLEANVALNKVAKGRIRTYRMDGRDFIREVVKRGVESDRGHSHHVAMNLPAMATEFLDAFKGLLNVDDDDVGKVVPEVIVHVYAFGKDGRDEIEERCAQSLNVERSDLKAIKVHFVRNVAPYKDMYRATFQLPAKVMLKCDEPDNKKPRI